MFASVNMKTGQWCNWVRPSSFLTLVDTWVHPATRDDFFCADTEAEADIFTSLTVFPFFFLFILRHDLLPNHLNFILLFFVFLSIQPTFFRFLVNRQR